MLAANKLCELNGNLNATPLQSRLNGRVNILDFSKFGGVRYFADLRYVYRTPILYDYPSIRNEVLKSQRVQVKISELVNAGYGNFDNISQKASNFYEGIRANISKVWTRFLGWLMFKIFRRLFKRLLVVPEQLNALKEAHDTGIPIVYLPLHKSHMDCQIITWTAWHFGLRIMHVAAGDNLNLSGLGWFLRATGAFFIKRHLEPNEQSTRDILYRAVLKSYMIGLLKSGQSLEFFLEGTRSRMGKTLLPKNGLISNIVESHENGELGDCYLVPVSINYDAPIEGIFYHELMGIRKPKESLVNVFFGMVNSFWLKHACGVVAVDFGKPVLLSTQLKIVKESSTSQGLDYATNANSYRELLPWNDHSINHKTLIRAIGYQLVHDAQRQKPIGIPSLISILFLCKYRTRHVKLSDLIVDLCKLMDEIQNLNHEVVGWFIDEETPEDLVLSNISHLNDAIETFTLNGDLVLKAIDCHESWIIFAYHKNNALSPFTIISIAAIVSQLKPENGTPIDLIKQMQILCSFLRYEVLLCSPLEVFEDRAKSSLEFFNKHQNAFEASFYYRLIMPFIETLSFVTSYILANPAAFSDLTDAAFIRKTAVEMTASEVATLQRISKLRVRVQLFESTENLERRK
ncbi:hypothetical protein M3Y97_00053300 [Aphelenchoides bicaudatus]|nr:hypothetical protein M3Y97_00053300 [Aphelenchoides bicaudatus]